MQLGRAGRVMVAFMLHASASGVLLARLPEIQQSLGLSESEFGLILVGMPVGVVIGSVLISPLVDILGPRLLILVGTPAFGVLAVLSAFAPSGTLLVAALAVFGFGFAAGNLALNVEADRIEWAEDRRILNRCHGWWALGFLVASVVSVGLIRLGVSPAAELIGLAALLTVLSVIFIAPMPVSAPRPSIGRAGRRFALPGKGTWLLGAFATAGIVLEGATRSWAVIYVRDVFAAADWLAAVALPSFVVTQMTGRFVGDGLVDRWGSVAVARVMALILLAGTLLSAVAPTTEIALIGLAVIGLGISIAVPQAFSGSARWGDRPAAEGIAAFATLSTVISFIGPPVFGIVAQSYGLRAGFAVFLPLPLVALYFARYLSPRTVA